MSYYINKFTDLIRTKVSVDKGPLEDGDDTITLPIEEKNVEGLKSIDNTNIIVGLEPEIKEKDIQKELTPNIQINQSNQIYNKIKPLDIDKIARKEFNVNKLYLTYLGSHL